MVETSLRVRRRLLLAGDGERSIAESVFCPARASSVQTAACRTCAHAHAVSPDAVLCSPPGPAEPLGIAARAGSLALPRVTLVRDDAGPEVLVDAARIAPWHVAVVDERDRFIGFVSTGLLELPLWPWRRGAPMMARDLVTGSTLIALETDSVARALRTMAHRRARSLALVDRDGVLHGVLSDLDALGALAAEARRG